MRFSDDPNIAEQQMHAVIFYLTTFGYIDGDFDASERAFVRRYIHELVKARADETLKDAASTVTEEIVAKYTNHFHEVFEGIDRDVKDLFTEVVADGEDQPTFVRNKLKLRCFEIFKSFDEAGQEGLLETIDKLVLADGFAHPAEVEFRAELARLLDDAQGIELIEEGDTATASQEVRVLEKTELPPSNHDHGFFQATEKHYSRDPLLISQQVQADVDLLDRVERLWDEQRKEGNGRLKGVTSIEAVPEGAHFLDQHVHVNRPPAGRAYELLVLGDLHGCYSVLKAAIMQARFFEKVDAYRTDPKSHPIPYLILLGDYIDRGMYSLNGVLRTVLQLVAAAPEHVYAIRGNHEYYVEVNGNIYGGVKPSESINTLKPHLSVDVFRKYMRFFESMPTSILFDRLFFVHAGIPRDRTIKEVWKDLGSLNDPDVRFQMMWSDPSTADVIPAELQGKTARFPFGRLQAKAFLQRLGSHTLVRGHEKVAGGFQLTYDEPGLKLITLFSSGGSDNADLPEDSSYRSVTPMALTVASDGERLTYTPWAPDFRSYNDPARNAFFRMPPEIKHRSD